MTDATGSGLSEQLLDEPFRPLIVALAEVMVSRTSLGVDKKQSWPSLVPESAPNRKVVVDRDRIGQSHVLYGTAYVVDVPLEWELGCMHADHQQSLILVFLRPGTDI